jgi:hypothetical protein
LVWREVREVVLADTACHVIGCRAVRETRAQNALDDVASINCLALSAGVERAEWRGGRRHSGHNRVPVGCPQDAPAGRAFQIPLASSCRGPA